LIGSTELIPALLQYADINLLTSSSEPFGIVLLEGGLLHKPTLLPSTGCEAANWLIIDRETGSLFEQNNATDLADKIEYMLTHPDYAQTCGDNLHDKVVREFLPAQTVHTILDLIAQLLEQKRSLHA
jgi:glycosyltransferase involved in cell wall biosynthesis